MRDHPLLSLFGLLCLLAGAPVRAEQITVDVTGKLTASACTPNLVVELANQGGVTNNNLLTLVEAKTHELDEAGNTAGGTQIRFVASGCTGSNVNSMWVHFTSSDVDDDGRIIPNGSTALRFEIRDNDTDGDLIRVGGTAPPGGPGAQQGSAAAFSGTHPTDTQRVANKDYGVRYYAAAPVPAGSYFAIVTAHFQYY